MRAPLGLRPSRSATAAVVDHRFPLMDASSAVSPTVRIEGATLWLAYYLPKCQDSAVVQFVGASTWFYGEPNDEGLISHHLWKRGLEFYSFHRADPNEEGNCWVATFHDGTFEIVASDFSVAAARMQRSSPSEALSRTLGAGRNEALD